MDKQFSVYVHRENNLSARGRLFLQMKLQQNFNKNRKFDLSRNKLQSDQWAFAALYVRRNKNTLAKIIRLLSEIILIFLSNFTRINNMIIIVETVYYSLV